MWRELLAFLASLAADPAVIDAECPKACACVAVARASMEKEKAPEPEVTPEPEPEATPEPPKVDEPPLVPVKPRATGRIECRNGTCYWVEEGTGRRYRIAK